MSFRLQPLCWGLLAALFLAPQLRAAGPEWMQDFEKAKAKAAAEKKDLLIGFTGSDWCPPCQMLASEVFSKDEFQPVTKSFVLLELDFPNNKEHLTPEIQAQNARLAKEYAIKGYPTVLLTDAQGVPYASTGYRRGGPDGYLTHLHDLIQGREVRDAAFAKAEEAEGVEKAKLIAEGLSGLDDALLVKFYRDKVAEVIKNDPEDTLGKRVPFQEMIAVDKYNALINAASPKGIGEILKVINQAIDDPEVPDSIRAQFIENKVRILVDENKVEQAIAFLDETIKNAAPDQVAGARMRKARVLNNLGEVEEALAMLDLIVEKHKDDKEQVGEARLGKAMMLARLDRLDEALKTFDEIGAEHQDNAELMLEAYFTKGKLLYNADRVKEAITAFEKAREYGNAEEKQMINQAIGQLQTPQAKP